MLPNPKTIQVNEPHSFANHQQKHLLLRCVVMMITQNRMTRSTYLKKQ